MKELDEDDVIPKSELGEIADEIEKNIRADERQKTAKAIFEDLKKRGYSKSFVIKELKRKWLGKEVQGE